MTSWTTPAKEEVDSYLNNVRASIVTSGADASEVIDDLKRHIDAEIHSAQLETVTRDDVRRIVHRLGVPDAGPEGGVALEPPPPKAPPRAAPDTRNGHHHPMPERLGRPGGLVLFFGVILPFFTLAVEFFTHFCASAFFDPIPSFLHVLAVAAVPLTNLLLWRALRGAATRRWTALAWFNGIAAGVALFFTLRYLFLLAPAVIALVFFGLGLLPMTPLLSLIATLRLRRRLSHVYPLAPWNLAWAMLIGCGLVLALDLPVMVTHAGMSMASSDSSQTRARGIRLLRLVGDEQTMLRTCYGRSRAASEMDTYSLVFAPPVRPEAARDIYYRVHGRPFNAVPPPPVFTTQGRWTAAEREFTWDTDQGGEAVAGRVKGLSLAASRMDGLVDSDGAVGYLEWTLEFNNVSSLQREARAQIALPAGGVVSRLTLWVNGEEREAAFAGRGQVREAYRNVVVVQRRDPVLVTTAGPDRVLMQCFPVPPDGGKMKVRLGITAPLAILNGQNGFLSLPCFLERNFTVAEDFRHSVWLESNQSLTADGLTATKSTEGAFALRGETSDVAFAALKVARTAPWQNTLATDPRRAGQFVRQTITQTAAPRVDRAVLVVDTSASMEGQLAQVADALKALPGNVRVTMLLPGDEDVKVIEGENSQTLARRVRWISPLGGKDNVPALIRAWDIAASNANTAIVWIHGAQPSLSRSFEQFKQRLDWHAQSATIIDVPAELAPNRLLEKLDGVPAVRTLPRTKSLTADLERLFASWTPGAQAFEVTREPTSEPGAQPRSSSHVVRLWALDQIRQMLGRRHTTGALELAARYQLVTPVSGAVVLETKEQFQQAGLTPVDAATVPSVPEPATWALLLLALAGLWLCRRRARQKVA